MKNKPLSSIANIINPTGAAGLEMQVSILKITNESLATELDLLKNQNSILVSQLEILQHNIGIFQRAMFGKKSEKLSEENTEQLNLFDKAEAGSASQSGLDFGDEGIKTSAKTGNKPGRKPLPKDLPRKQIIHDLPDSEKTCPCGCELTKIGSENSEQLDYKRLHQPYLGCGGYIQWHC